MENCVTLWISGRSTIELEMITLIKITQSAVCQMQHNTWKKGLSSASSTARKHITVCRGRFNGQWKCLHSFLLEELLPTKDLHEVLADLCLPFQASSASTWTQLSKLTLVLKMWMMLGLQPKMQRISPRRIGRSSSAFFEQN